MRRFGDFVAGAGGDYLPGVDMGTAVTDLALMSESGATVSCATEDPSRWTATGRGRGHPRRGRARRRPATWRRPRPDPGRRATSARRWPRLLAADGATVLIADVDGDRAARAGRASSDGQVVDPRDRDRHPLRRVRPLRRGPGASTPTPIGRLHCSIVAGAANDTLGHRADAELLAARGITYVPDFVANAGGVVHIHGLRMRLGRGPACAREVLRIGDRARPPARRRPTREGWTPLAVAEQMAADRLAAARAGRDGGVA